jgi:hypothetical protein
MPLHLRFAAPVRACRLNLMIEPKAIGRLASFRI